MLCLTCYLSVLILTYFVNNNNNNTRVGVFDVCCISFSILTLKTMSVSNARSLCNSIVRRETSGYRKNGKEKRPGNMTSGGNSHERSCSI